MAIEKEVLPLLQWLFPTEYGFGALLGFSIALSVLIVVTLFFAYLFNVIRHGPGESFYVVAKAIARAVGTDLPGISFRRIGAVMRLAIKESLRNRVLAAFAVFAVLLLFAGWFLDTQSDHPARLYISFVLNATGYLIILTSVFLSAFSLPRDIKSRTIYTVMTKPVRAGELVAGRILGFCAINTMLLVLMFVVSLIFVWRGLSHTHDIDPASMEKIAATSTRDASTQGETSFESFHRHDVSVGEDGHGQSSAIMDHYHHVHEGDDGEFAVSSPEGSLLARSPIYGTLRFLDRTGRPTSKGLSVGKEWSYRSYIEGGSLGSAIWTFQNLNPDNFPEALPLEMDIRVFRTNKGDIVSGIPGTITVVNPDTGVRSERLSFVAREFVTYTYKIPRRLKVEDEDGQLKEVDLFEEMVDENGQLEIWVRCSEYGQYYGVARPDIYIRDADGSFVWNFAKAYIGIWLQMIIITCFGVMFSTFLSGPVAAVATFTVYLLGYFREFIMRVATGEQIGGGPTESFIRIVSQKNLSTDLEMGAVFEWIILVADKIYMGFMWLFVQVLPDYNSYNTSSYVAYGFDINNDLLLQNCFTAFAFAVILSVYGYFFLKAREVAG